MKNILTILLIFNFSNCFSQDIMDIALSDKTKLINEDVYQIRLKNDKWNISNYLNALNEQGIINDSIVLVNLINKSLKTKPEKWKKENLKKAYLVKKSQKILQKKVLAEIEILDKREIKTIKRQIRQYNNRPNEWRGWPMSISKPIFSDNNQFCIIGFQFGNNGGYTELYKKVDSKWKQIGIFNRIAY